MKKQNEIRLTTGNLITSIIVVIVIVVTVGFGVYSYEESKMDEKMNCNLESFVGTYHIVGSSDEYISLFHQHEGSEVGDVKFFSSSSKASTLGEYRMVEQNILSITTTDEEIMVGEIVYINESFYFFRNNDEPKKLEIVSEEPISKEDSDNK